MLMLMAREGLYYTKKRKNIDYTAPQSEAIDARKHDFQDVKSGNEDRILFSRLRLQEHKPARTVFQPSL